MKKQTVKTVRLACNANAPHHCSFGTEVRTRFDCQAQTTRNRIINGIYNRLNSSNFGILAKDASSPKRTRICLDGKKQRAMNFLTYFFCMKFVAYSSHIPIYNLDETEGVASLIEARKNFYCCFY